MEAKTPDQIWSGIMINAWDRKRFDQELKAYAESYASPPPSVVEAKEIEKAIQETVNDIYDYPEKDKERGKRKLKLHLKSLFKSYSNQVSAIPSEEEIEHKEGCICYNYQPLPPPNQVDQD